MANTTDFVPGGYRFNPEVFQYSAGVAALPGCEIQRFTSRTLVPLSEGFQRVEQILTQAGRPLTALCACELRSQGPFAKRGFRKFAPEPHRSRDPATDADIDPAVEPGVLASDLGRSVGNYEIGNPAQHGRRALCSHDRQTHELLDGVPQLARIAHVDREAL
jgi:hypothetical protein